MTQAMLERDHHLIRDGQVILGDQGFAGREFEAFVESIGAHLIRPDRKDENPRFGNWLIGAPRKRSLIAYDH